MELIFLGTPSFAVPTLERIVAAGHPVLAVFTQPDRPKGRGGQLAASPVKEAALRWGLAVYQPERVRRPEVVEQLRGMRPEAMVVVGYGQIIPQSIIDIPSRGIVNVHASLLPKYRGAAPIQWAVANGESRTGVTTMRIDAGLDTGDMLLKWETGIGAEENAIELGERLARAGADLLIETLRKMEAGAIQPEPQDDSEATLAPILKKEDGIIDWTWPAAKIFNRTRGFLPWPGAYSFFRGQVFHIWKSRVAAGVPSAEPGRMIPQKRRLLVACGEQTALELVEVQIEGRKRMSAEAFLNGQHLHDNETLGVTTA
ncbi:MAG TPA: methionyl-tRNA formyltransferase [Bryobacteraceae bacterium]|nr:methionyl-tRNA formyltransferase [Bryobacteraceae bacterium]